MGTYKCRFSDMNPADVAVASAICDYTQQTYWTGIRQILAWSPKLLANIKLMTNIVAEDKQGKIVGFLLMQMQPSWKPPTVKIYALAALHTLTEREQLCVNWSLLLFGSQLCIDAGIERGEGEVTGPNDPMLAVFRRVEKYLVKEEGRTPSLVAVERKVLTHRVTVSPLDAAYQQALKDAIKGL